MNEIVIDANVLGFAVGEDLNHYNAENEKAMLALLMIKQLSSIMIGIDNDKEILEEYERRAKNDRALGNWIKELQWENRFYYHSGGITSNIINRLQTLKFHDKDVKYIDVSLDTPDPKVIINQIDSDWSPAVCTYLKTLGIDVINSGTFINTYLSSFQAALSTDNGPD